VVLAPISHTLSLVIAGAQCFFPKIRLRLRESAFLITSDLQTFLRMMPLLCRVFQLILHLQGTLQVLISSFSLLLSCTHSPVLSRTPRLSITSSFSPGLQSSYFSPHTSCQPPPAPFLSLVQIDLSSVVPLNTQRQQRQEFHTCVEELISCRRLCR
jgi:hypothetical protein